MTSKIAVADTVAQDYQGGIDSDILNACHKADLDAIRKLCSGGKINVNQEIGPTKSYPIIEASLHLKGLQSWNS